MLILYRTRRRTRTEITDTANVRDVIAIPVFFIVVGLVKLDSVPSGGFIPGVVSKSIALKSIPCSRILYTIKKLLAGKFMGEVFWAE